MAGGVAQGVRPEFKPQYRKKKKKKPKTKAGHDGVCLLYKLHESHTMEDQGPGQSGHKFKTTPEK
jgi:hypothetical protein